MGGADFKWTMAEQKIKAAFDFVEARVLLDQLIELFGKYALLDDIIQQHGFFRLGVFHNGQ